MLFYLLDSEEYVINFNNRGDKDGLRRSQIGNGLCFHRVANGWELLRDVTKVKQIQLFNSSQTIADSLRLSQIVTKLCFHLKFEVLAITQTVADSQRISYNFLLANRYQAAEFG